MRIINVPATFVCIWIRMDCAELEKDAASRDEIPKIRSEALSIDSSFPGIEDQINEFWCKPFLLP